MLNYSRGIESRDIVENKVVKDTTKEDHFVNVVGRFKIIYNQNEYLAYLEMPKKKKEIIEEIYVGRLSKLKDQYLLFKCETASEKDSVFQLFKQFFGGEPCDKIEKLPFSEIERMSIVSSNLFDEKIEQYPNFFPQPKKEEDIDASINITLPSFLMKKKPASVNQPQEEIQFVDGIDEILKPNEAVGNIENPNLEQHDTNGSFGVHPEKVESSIPTSEQVKIQSDVLQPTENNVATLESSTASGQTKINNNLGSTIPEQNIPIINEIPAQSINNTLGPIPTVENNAPTVGLTGNQTNIVSPAVSQNNQSVVNQVPQETKSKTKNSKKLLVILMALVVIIVVALIVIVVTQSSKKPEPPKQDPTPTPPVVTNPTKELNCTLSNEEENGLTVETRIFKYEVGTKKILSEEINTSYRYSDKEEYDKIKAEIEALEEVNTSGRTITYSYQDDEMTYTKLEKRDYEKATDEEKDETWKNTYDEAYNYYFELGYTCDGVAKPKEKTLDLTELNGKEAINFNSWVIKYKKAVLSDDEKTLTVTLEVENQGEIKRELNGRIKLYNQEKKNVRSGKVNHEVEAKQTQEITVVIQSTNPEGSSELGSLEEIKFTDISSYLIEIQSSI